MKNTNDDSIFEVPRECEDNMETKNVADVDSSKIVEAVSEISDLTLSQVFAGFRRFEKPSYHIIMR